MSVAGLAGARWITSSYSGGNGNCVEVAVGLEHAGVRDTKDRAGGALIVPERQWRSFINAVKSAHYEL
ncbi:protein of unknown function [Saccharopolyspora shandongensis]|uniref:DUF397 domain-containing protein n=1 Tax=Saccharopolyspora shandongensis TaxID=418495 RepID=A0A1H3RJG4_9PSEU|nr:DUF397 domain-containing protein [Saccharopolyspora shandongensis]SDZ25770.1 protein of unknown function [Saccharopolyspora shandongensis]